MNLRHLGALAAMVAASLAAVSGASATPMTYSGFDPGVLKMSDAHPNASAEHTAYTGALVPGSAMYEAFNYYGNTGPNPIDLPTGGQSLWSTGQGKLTGAACDSKNDVNCHTYFTDSGLSGGSKTGRFDTSGPDANGFPSYWFETDKSFSIDFGSAYSAFGFYATDAGDFGGTYTMTLVNADGSDGQTLCVTTTNVNVAAMYGGCQIVTGSSNGGLMFFGFTDSQTAGYKGVRFNITQGPGTPDIIGFDDLVLGQVAQLTNDVPEPGSLALVALSLVGAGVAGRKRSS